MPLNLLCCQEWLGTPAPHAPGSQGWDNSPNWFWARKGAVSTSPFSSWTPSMQMRLVQALCCLSLCEFIICICPVVSRRPGSLSILRVLGLYALYLHFCSLKSPKRKNLMETSLWGLCWVFSVYYPALSLYICSICYFSDDGPMGVAKSIRIHFIAMFL